MEPPGPPPPPPPRQPLSEAEVKQALENVRVQLDLGNEAPAVIDLQRVLADHPQHKAALSFLRQMREDPQQLYGSASYPYRVLSGDTLATIAQKQMNDRDQFYGLARYNSITEPRRLEVGRTIRIPGKAPLATLTSIGTAAVAAEKAAAEKAAAEKAAAEKAAAEKAAAEKAAAEKAAAKRAELAREIERLMKLGFARAANQDPCGAAKAFDDVLKLDPANTRASLERESALSLARRIPKKC